jgi:Tfp pilus assembly protein PilN
MKSNTVFSISEGMVKFLQVTAAQKKLVTGVGVIDTDNKNDAQISQALRAFIKERKLNFTESRVTIVVPRSRVILRYMAFPSLKPEEIRSMINLQIGSQIPFSKEEVEIDFQILTKTEDGYAKVAVVIIPQELAMRNWKIFSDAAIPVQGITVSSIGLWLLYQQQPDLPDKLGAVVDLDAHQSEICICNKSYWLTSREIPIGSAQIQKDGYGEILRQWELTQNNTGNEEIAGHVETVLLACAANRAHELENEMTKTRNDLKFKEIFLPQTLVMARGVQWPKAMIENGVSVASLAGIAFSSQPLLIDLTPRSVKQAQEQRVYQRQLVILGIWITASLISLGLALGMGFFRKNVQLARLENQLRDTKRDAFKVEEQLQKVYDIESMIENRLIFSDVAREIYRLLPTQVYLVNITISDGSTLSLQGISSNSMEINQFQKGMVDSKSFYNVSLDYVNKRVTQQAEVDYFKITCMVKSGNIQK